MELAFPWAKHQTELGIEYIPECTMAVQSKDKAWFERIFKIDTGSNVTFMDIQDCYKLGYTQNDLGTYYFTNANKERSRAYVRNFTVRIGDYIIKRVPIAFSAKPVETLLLGRAKIFDCLNVCFDCKSKKTILFTPDERK